MSSSASGDGCLCHMPFISRRLRTSCSCFQRVINIVLSAKCSLQCRQVPARVPNHPESSRIMLSHFAQRFLCSAAHRSAAIRSMCTSLPTQAKRFTLIERISELAAKSLGHVRSFEHLRTQHSVPQLEHALGRSGARPSNGGCLPICNLALSCLERPADRQALVARKWLESVEPPKRPQTEDYRWQPVWR